MSKRLLTPLCLFILISHILSAQWQALDTGLTQDINGVVFFQHNGLISTLDGLYITTNGGADASSWTRFEITGNSADAAIYNTTNFTHCYADPTNDTNNGVLYACGVNTANNKAILMRITLPSMAYELFTIPIENSQLNQVKFNTFTYDSNFYAVGNNGLFLKIEDNSYTIIDTGTAEDFLCIDFDNSTIPIGFDGGVYVSQWGSGSIIETPNLTSKGIIAGLESNEFFSVGDTYFRIKNEEIFPNENYDFGPLNGNEIVLSNNVAFIGTNHGIFTSSFPYDVLEWQESSGDYNIKAFWQNNEILYACGTNGTLLKTENQGGSPLPYVYFDAENGCQEDTKTFYPITGSSTSCNWYINGELVSSSCSSLSHYFDEAGTYEIKLITENDESILTEKVKNITIVALPDIDKPFMVSDTFLCRSEQIEIQIEDSQNEVFYLLKKKDSSLNYGSSGAGNGSTITFTTDSLDTAGTYYLFAQSTLANCTQNFTPSTFFDVEVESTTADFHADLINANINELVNLYETTTDAQYFEWTFPNHASIASSSSPNPSISFSNDSNGIINLSCWSDNGCSHDSDFPTPNILDENPILAPCWDIYNQANLPQIPGGDDFYDLTCMSPASNGFLVTGQYNNQLMESQLGVSFTLSGHGVYLSKYDEKGTLKWVVHSVTWGNTTSCIEDKEGNIYLAGFLSGLFTDNAGNEITIGYANDTSHGVIIKINARGEYIWHLQMENYIPSALTVDFENNLIINGNYAANTNNHAITLNGINTGVIGEQITDPYLANTGLIKLSSEGVVLWNTIFYFQGQNGYIASIGTDALGNIYATGNFRTHVDFHSTNTTVIHSLERIEADNNGQMYLTKYGTHGNHIWSTRSYMHLLEGISGSYGNITPNSMVVDEAGNCYITGSNLNVAGPYGTAPLNDEHIFENTDGSFFLQKGIGSYFTQKVNTDGLSQWLVGSGISAQAGHGLKITKNGNEITILGSVGFGTEEFNIPVFTSTDERPIFIPNTGPEYFLATYNLSGEIQKVLIDWNTIQAPLYRQVPIHIIKTEEDAFILARVAGPPEEEKGIISRIQEACGHAYYFDNIPPMAECKDIDIYINIDNNYASLIVADIDNNSTDNSGIVESYSLISDQILGCNRIGSNEVTLTLFDYALNTSTCTSIVGVLDSIPPVAMANDIQLDLFGSSSISISAADINAGSYDNCEIASTTLSQSIFTTPGVFNISLIVTDGSGNISTAPVIVTIIDSTVGIDEPHTLDLEVYPNPVNKILTIKANEPLSTIILSNLLGQVLTTIDAKEQKEVQVNFEAMTKGIYWVKIKGKNEWTIKKVLR